MSAEQPHQRHGRGDVFLRRHHRTKLLQAQLVELLRLRVGGVGRILDRSEILRGVGDLLAIHIHDVGNFVQVAQHEQPGVELASLCVLTEHLTELALPDEHRAVDRFLVHSEDFEEDVGDALVRGE